jgi:hypothetical protein
MPNKAVLLTLLPLIFMLHDFEEITMMKSWFAHNQDFLLQKFPRLGRRLVYHIDGLSTASFAFGVGEEFLILSIVTVSALTDKSWLYVWFGIFLVFTLHLIYHCLTAVVLRRYVVALATSLLFLPICILLIFRFLALYQLNAGLLLIWTIIALIFVLANGAFLHLWLILKFDKWLKSYERRASL